MAGLYVRHVSDPVAKRSLSPGLAIRVARRICEWGFPLMMLEGSRISQSRRSGWLGYIRRWDLRAGVFLSGGSRFDLKGL